MLDGWAARYQLISDGRRQIISLLLPGDHFGLRGTGADGAELPIVVLTRVKLTSAAQLRNTIADVGSGEHDGLRQAMVRADNLSTARLVAQVVRLGRQSAYERTAHFIAELHHRLMAVNLATADQFDSPLTQECMADILGLSVVHVNRTMQQLRKDGVIRSLSGAIRIVSVEKLLNISDYEPDHIEAFI